MVNNYPMVIVAKENNWPFILSGFFLILFTGCISSNNLDPYSIIWENEKAVGVQFSKTLLRDFEVKKLKVHLEGKSQEILGSWDYNSGDVLFRPIVAFSPGEKYVLTDGTKPIITYSVDRNLGSIPEIQRIYPSTDTVPSNLLKVYIQFSKSMTVGNSLDHISVLNLTSGDTLEGTFLDLQPELWNKDYSILTLWLDPGRIKRGLIPNQKLGVPIESFQNYKLIISKSWEDTQGLSLEENFEKEFKTVARDEVKVLPNQWEINAPEIETTDPLNIQFHESLDGVLLTETMEILDTENHGVAGNFHLGDKEREIFFSPAKMWEKGKYIIRIQSRLEDLAGNNLNRLFDSQMDGLDKEEVDYAEIDFYIN